MAKVDTSNTQFRGGSGGGVAFPMIILWLVVAYMLFGCGPAAKLRRAEKLIAKAELQGATWKVDTVKETIEIIVPETRIDTVVKVRQGETVFIDKEKQSIKIIRLPGDSIFVDCKCKPKTIYKNITHTVTKNIKSGRSGWYYFKWGAFLFVIGLILGFFAIRIIKILLP